MNIIFRWGLKSGNNDNQVQSVTGFSDARRRAIARASEYHARRGRRVRCTAGSTVTNTGNAVINGGNVGVNPAPHYRLSAGNHSGTLWPACLQDDLAMIQRNTLLKIRLIDDLLDITRIAHGKIELKMHTVNLQDIIQRAIDFCRSDIDTRQLELTVDASCNPIYLQADPDRLQQVFWNLLRNAIVEITDDGI